MWSDTTVDVAVASALFADRQFAYVVVDCTLHVQRVGGNLALLGTECDARAGATLWDLAPELVGSEAEIQALLAGKRSRVELTLIQRSSPAARSHYVELVNLPYRNATGEIVGILHCVEDITELGELKQHLMQQRNELLLLRDRLAAQNVALSTANAELQRLDEMKSQFVSIAAHELRTPLAAIVGYVDLLLDPDFDPLTENQQQSLETIDRGAKRLLSITNDLLDVTSLEAGRLDLTLRPANLMDLMETAAHDLQPTITAKRQHLILDAAPDVPLVLCDESRVLQILTNLLSNANKYTSEAGTITLRAEPAARAGFVQLSVTDTGIGIPAEDQKSLFRHFFRASNASSTGASGAGLGLHIVHSLVELHGGAIWFESEMGAGTTFYVTLPASDTGVDVEPIDAMYVEG